MSTLTLAPGVLHGLAVDNDVQVQWVSAANPLGTTWTRGRVVALSTETVHVATPSGRVKIINLERVTGVTVTGQGRLALHKQAAAVQKLREAADCMARGEVIWAQAALATAIHFAPELREDWA